MVDRLLYKTTFLLIGCLKCQISTQKLILIVLSVIAVTLVNVQLTSVNNAMDFWVGFAWKHIPKLQF